MKKVFIILIVLFINQLGINSQTIPDSCWKLIWQHDPDKGYFNPDSVIYDSCRFGDLSVYYKSSMNIPEEIYLQFYVKKYFRISLPVGALDVPWAPRDSLIIRYWSDIDSSFNNLKIGLHNLDSIVGIFKLKKVFPEIIDSNDLRSRTWSIIFDNYVNIDSTINFLKSIENLQESYYQQFAGIYTNIDSKRFDDDELILFPQPANEYIEINFERCPTSLRCWTSEQIEISNIFGERFLTIPETRTPNPQKVDVSDLPVGVYFVRIGEFVGRFVKL